MKNENEIITSRGFTTRVNLEWERKNKHFNLEFNFHEKFNKKVYGSKLMMISLNDGNNTMKILFISTYRDHMFAL